VRLSSLTAIAVAGAVLGACGSEPSIPQVSPEASQASPPSGGRIRGVVRLRGSAPEQGFEKVSKDQQTCGQQVPVTRLTLGADNGVRHAFVYLEGVHVPPETPLSAQAAVPIEQRGCVYSPHATTVSAGTKLHILNDDPILHNVHARQLAGDQRKTIFNIAQPLRGQRTLVEPGLGTPGIVELTCEAGHPWMTGYVLVADHPFSAVTSDNGGFEITGVPAGTYRLKMWHEGVRLTNIFASVQQYEYEPPYEETREVVVPASGDITIDFELALRKSQK
jgi:plastocyanin